jgi:hypothetical protein
VGTTGRARLGGSVSIAPPARTPPSPKRQPTRLTCLRVRASTCAHGHDRPAEYWQKGTALPVAKITSEGWRKGTTITLEEPCPYRVLQHPNASVLGNPALRGTT